MKKRFTPVALAAALLLCAVPVHAAEMARTERQAIERVLEMDVSGTPNWFNGAYYSGRYEDLKRAFGDDEVLLYQHCLTFGFREGRIVLPVLDVVKYRAYYPDLEQAFGDNWSLYIRHYFEFGIKEGRKNFTDFDAETYLELNPDLKDICGTSRTAATIHYLEHGFAEGRTYIRAESKTEENTKVTNSSDRDDSESGHFTGEKKIIGENGTYEICSYVNGRLTAGKRYDQEDKLIFEAEYDGDFDKLLKSILYLEDGSETETTYEYDADGKLKKVISKMYTQAGDLQEWAEIEYTDGKPIRQTAYAYNDLEYDEVKNVILCNAVEEPISESIYSYKDGNLIMKAEYLFEDGKQKKSSVYIYDEKGEMIQYSVSEFDENEKLKKHTTIECKESPKRVVEAYYQGGENAPYKQNVYWITVATDSNASLNAGTSAAAYRAEMEAETATLSNASPSNAGRISERSAVAG